MELTKEQLAKIEHMEYKYESSNWGESPGSEDCDYLLKYDGINRTLEVEGDEEDDEYDTD